MIFASHVLSLERKYAEFLWTDDGGRAVHFFLERGGIFFSRCLTGGRTSVLQKCPCERKMRKDSNEASDGQKDEILIPRPPLHLWVYVRKARERRRFLFLPLCRSFGARRRTLAGLVHTCVGRSWSGGRRTRRRTGGGIRRTTAATTGNKCPCLFSSLANPSRPSRHHFPFRRTASHSIVVLSGGMAGATQYSKDRAQYIVVAAVCAQPRRAANNQIRPRVKQQERSRKCPNSTNARLEKGKKSGSFLKGRGGELRNFPTDLRMGGRRGATTGKRDSRKRKVVGRQGDIDSPQATRVPWNIGWK